MAAETQYNVGGDTHHGCVVAVREDTYRGVGDFSPFTIDDSVWTL